MSGTVSTQTGALATRKSPWIYNPWLDLMVGCGAWSAPLLLLSYFFAQSSSQIWSFGFYTLALLFNYPHFMATVYRAYHTPTEIAKYRIFTVHITLLLAVAGLAGHLWYPLVPWVFTTYICWSPWHYTGQNFGLLMMFTRRAGISPTAGERRALYFAFVASYALLMLSFHTGASSDALILSLGLLPKFTVPARFALAVFFLGSSVWTLVRMGRRGGWKVLLAPATLIATQFFWFLMPVLIELSSGHEVPQTRYSSGILAVLHSAQYLWITSYYQAREARGEGATNWKFWRYALTLVAGGIALFIPGPWIASRVFHADFATSFLLFAALVNIHHFVLDGALWKLRDSRIAAMLLDAKGKSSEVAAGTATKLLAGAKWMAGSSRTASAARIAGLLLLLAWGFLDQRHFYLASQLSDTVALEQAAKWIPNDSSVQLRLASAERSKGETEAEIEALRNAAAANPKNLTVLEVYARGLLEAHRYDEAYELYRKILIANPKNANAWTNAGLLAAQLRHEEEAVDDWQRAVEIEANQANAQLYLAQGLERRGEMQAGARHYRTYLEIVAEHPSEHRNETGQIIAALIKVADADVQAEKLPEALQSYKAAASFAEKSGDKAMQSLALAHLAEAEEKSGNADTAVASFQQALRLDAQLTDSKSGATDWFNYGQFLRRQHQDEQLVFACYLEAEKFLENTPGEAAAAVSAERARTEMRLGRAAAKEVHKKFEDELQKALTLPLNPSAKKP